MNVGGSAGDLTEVTNGTLFLSLKGHLIDAAGNTNVGQGANINTISPTGFSSGLLDVDLSSGAIANTFFDTSSIPALFGGSADFELGSSYTGLHRTYPAECTTGQGPACARGSSDFTSMTTSSPEPPTQSVPEPATLLMFSSGLVSVGLGTYRKAR
jgi:hypothetical protein